MHVGIRVVGNRTSGAFSGLVSDSPIEAKVQASSSGAIRITDAASVIRAASLPVIFSSMDSVEF